MIKAFQLILNLVLYIHMKACIWFYICKTYKKWLPPIFWSYPVNEDHIEETFFITGNHVQQYIISLYYSVLMMRPNELGPRSNTETLICGLILVLDLIVAANIYGSVAVLV
jgi:hypothetical protein